MENYNEDYYLIEEFGGYQSPMLGIDYDIHPDAKGCEYLMFGSMKGDENITAHLCFASPVPRKPQMVDYHFCECRQVFSKKIYDVFRDKEITGLQWISAIIEGKKGEKYTDYWIANAYQRYAFLDKEKSKYRSIDKQFGTWSGVDKMVINDELISQVPLEERLIFVTKEQCAYVLYHKSIVDLIMSVNPIGLKFIPLSEWYNGFVYKQ